MPGIKLTLSGQPDTGLVGRIVPELTALTSSVLEKRSDLTMVMVQFIGHEWWFIDSRSLSDHDRNSFRLEVTVTDETCTKVQKARYQREAFDLLSNLIGNVHPHSNVHIIDCRGSAYGYGGVTQEHKYHRT
ncbi:tautomerase family protein [Methylobacterium sp. CM6246]